MRRSILLLITASMALLACPPAHAGDRIVAFGAGLKSEDGQLPAVALGPDNIVVNIHQSQDSDHLWYRVGRASIYSIDWGDAIDYDTGGRPTAGVTDDYRVLEVHMATSPDDLYYRRGTVNPVNRQISWDGTNGIHFDHGYWPKLAINNSGSVVEVHGASDGRIFYNTGDLDRSGGVFPSHAGRQMTLPSSQGHDPDVAMTQDGLLVFTYHNNGKMYYRLAQFTTPGGAVTFLNSWTEYDTGAYPDISINEDDVVVEVHQSESGSTLWCRTGLLNRASATITWYGSARKYDSGIQPRATCNQDLAVEAHRSESSASIWWSTSYFTDRSRWMEAMLPEIADLPLRLVSMPLAHDAGTYDLMNGTQVPVDCWTGGDGVTAPVQQLLIALGTPLDNWAETQNKRISEQLREGVRALDLRPYRTAAGHWRAHHTLQSSAYLDTMLQDVRAFCETTNNELVILYVDRLCKSSGNVIDDATHVELLTLLDSILGPYLFRAPDCNLNQVRLGDIVGGGSRVILVYGGVQGDETGDINHSSWLVAHWDDWSEWDGAVWQRRFWPSQQLRGAAYCDASYDGARGLPRVELSANTHDAGVVWSNQRALIQACDHVPGTSSIISWQVTNGTDCMECGLDLCKVVFAAYPSYLWLLCPCLLSLTEMPVAACWDWKYDDLEEVSRGVIRQLGPFMEQEAIDAPWANLWQVDFVEFTRAADLCIERNRRAGGLVAVEELPARAGQDRLSVWPNPAFAGASITLAISAVGPVRISIHDVSGRLVRELATDDLAVGPRLVRWDGRDQDNRRVSSGVYFCRMKTTSGVGTQRVVFVR